MEDFLVVRKNDDKRKLKIKKKKNLNVYWVLSFRSC